MVVEHLLTSEARTPAVLSSRLFSLFLPSLSLTMLARPCILERLQSSASSRSKRSNVRPTSNPKQRRASGAADNLPSSPASCPEFSLIYMRFTRCFLQICLALRRAIYRKARTWVRFAPMLSCSKERRKHTRRRSCVRVSRLAPFFSTELLSLLPRTTITSNLLSLSPSLLFRSVQET